MYKFSSMYLAVIQILQIPATYLDLSTEILVLTGLLGKQILANFLNFWAVITEQESSIQSNNIPFIYRIIVNNI